MPEKLAELETFGVGVLDRASVGLFAHNEVRAIETSIRSILDQTDEFGIGIRELIVVVSGDDGTAEIVKELGQQDKRVFLIVEEVRAGKAAAMNRFLSRAVGEFRVLASADIFLPSDTLRKLLMPFEDESVGMTGGAVKPLNPKKHLTNRLVHLLWELHNLVAMRQPKLGEIIVVRNVFDSIDERSTVDEVCIEAIIESKDYGLCFVPEAYVYKHGPTAFLDYARHRFRIHRGHLAIRKSIGYKPATANTGHVAASAGGLLRRRPHLAPLLFIAAAVEISVRIAARTAQGFGGPPQKAAWKPITSAKQRRACNIESETAPEMS